MSDILCTGSTGFVGSNLIPTLIRSYSITLVNRDAHSSRSEVLLSMSYNDYWKKYTSNNHYIHLAGKAHDLKNLSDESEYFEVNYELTKKPF